VVKFFRHIRQRLLRENKFSKYLLYAIGEIVLVVIGILIALQINNWNEAIKDHAYEVKMLSEIVKSLKADQLNLQADIDDYTILNNTVDHFTILARDRAIFHDSMYQDLWKLNIGKYLQFNRGPYDALKSSGIDRISNDSIRNHLINFFDFELGMFQSQIDHATRRYRANVELLLSLREEPYYDHTNNYWVSNQIPEDILQNPKFVWLLTDIDWRAGNAINRIENFIPKIDALIQHINTEIEK
jgi:hypothetical protein